MKRAWFIFAACLVLGGLLRLVGLTRGKSDFLLPGEAGLSAFYTFHPDEETLIRAALKLESLSAPPLTAYGTFPMVLARAWLEGAGLLCGSALEPERAFVFIASRVLSALLSLASLGLVFWIGRKYFDPFAACLAAFFMAVAPLAVQQAHFYTVDGVFTLVALAALGMGLGAAQAGRLWLYAASGLFIGLAAATRLNGLLLGVVLMVGHLLSGKKRGGWKEMAPGLKQPHLWLAAALALAVLLALEPYLASDPALMRRAISSDDFAYSLDTARGQVLRPWSLVDVHTLPYLHYWTHLWPQAAGWPLTLALAAGAGYALWRRIPAGLVVLSWSVLYCLSIGGLHTKHVRYLLPLLPCLGLLAGHLCSALWRSRWKWAGALAVAAIVVHAGTYGAAFARVYAVEDSRILAARWLYARAPEGSRIGVESGGFSMQKLISSSRYDRQYLNTGRLFGTRGYLNCEVGRQYLEGRMRELDFVVLVDANRYRQYTAVPEFFPVLAGLYGKLVAGELGFEPVQRFKVYPSLLGFEFKDDQAEPSFYAYDHPAVLIFRRRDDFAERWQAWKEELARDPHCADSVLGELAVALKGRDLDRVEKGLGKLRAEHPELRLAALLEIEAARQRHDSEARQEARARYLWGYSDPALVAWLIPWAAGASLLEVGLEELALEALVDGADKRAHFSESQRRDMSDAYIEIASGLLRKGERELGGEVYRLSTLIEARPAVCNTLAHLAYEDQRVEEALSWWDTSLRLDSTQVEILRLAGRAAYNFEHYGQALDFLARAVHLDTSLTPAQKEADYQALAEEAQRVGDRERARALQERIAAAAR
jgi:hypothetical protein